MLIVSRQSNALPFTQFPVHFALAMAAGQKNVVFCREIRLCLSNYFNEDWRLCQAFP